METGEVGAGGERVRMLGAEDPLLDEQQRSVPVAGPAASRLPGPAGKAGAGGQGVVVLRPAGIILSVSVGDQLEQVPDRRIAPAKTRGHHVHRPS